MGGMQVLEWGVMYPERVAGAASPIATAAAASAQQIGWWSSGRRVIRIDPRWRGGEYYDAEPGDGPHDGLATARMISMMTFRSDDVFSARFGREVVEPVEGFSLWQRFQVERYLEYQGDKLVRRFDANTLPAADQGDGPARPRPGAGAASTRRSPGCGRPLLSIGRQQRHPLPAPPVPRDRRAGQRAPGCDADYAELDSPHGHDAFLIEIDQLGAIAPPVPHPTGGRPMPDDRRATPSRSDGWHLDTRAIRAGRAVQPRLAGAGAVPVDHLRGGVGRRPRRAWPACPARATTTRASAARPCRSSRHAVADLEGAEAALAFGSGMAAITGAGLRPVLDRRPRRRPAPAVLGDEQRSSPPTCPRFGIDVTFVDGTDAAAVRRRGAAGAHPAGVRRDARQPGAVAHRHRGRGGDPGAVHGGRLDLRHARRAAAARPRRRPRPPRRHQGARRAQRRPARRGGRQPRPRSTPCGAWHVVQGGQASPFDAWNGLRGIRTLGVRVRQQAASAQRLAEHLEAHPAVASVSYPGLDSHPQRELAKRQMTSRRHAADVRAGGRRRGRPARSASATEIARIALSLGGPETLVTHPGHHRRPPHPRRAGRARHHRRTRAPLGRARARRRPDRRPRPGPRRGGGLNRPSGRLSPPSGHRPGATSRRPGSDPPVAGLDQAVDRRRR